MPQRVLAVLTTHARTHAPALAERACQLLALMVWNEESQTRLGKYSLYSVARTKVKY